MKPRCLGNDYPRIDHVDSLGPEYSIFEDSSLMKTPFGITLKIEIQKSLSRKIVITEDLNVHESVEQLKNYQYICFCLNCRNLDVFSKKIFF